MAIEFKDVVKKYTDPGEALGRDPDTGDVTGLKGWVSNAEGAAATTADGGTISHGLSVTPTTVRVTGSVAGEIVSVTAIASTTFTVAIKKPDGTAGTSQTVYWEAAA